MSKQATLERRRAARLAAERAAAAREPRGRRLWRLGAAAAAAAVLVAGADRRLRGGGAKPRAAATTSLAARRHPGNVTASLGAADAPITVTEFVDLQCPVCAATARELPLPTVVVRLRPHRQGQAGRARAARSFSARTP